MGNIQYFDYIDFDEETDETNAGIVAPDSEVGSADDESALNDQTHETTCDDWNFVETKVESQTGGAIKPGETFVLYARVWNDATGLFLKRSDIVSASASFYKKRMRNFAATDWLALDGWQEVAVPLDSFVDVEADWRYDPDEYNFAWEPSQVESVLCDDEGVYAAVVRMELTNDRLPVTCVFTIAVTE